MAKQYTESDVRALIEQNKRRRLYAIRIRDNDQYVEETVDRINANIAELEKQRDTLLATYANANDIIDECDANVKKYRQLLARAMHGDKILKLVALQRKVNAMEAELGIK